MSGFFLVTRGITSHPLFRGNPDRLAVWMWLLDNVAYKDTTQDVKGKTVHVPRGAVCASERHIAKECGVGYQVVRTAMKRFKSEHMVNAQVTQGKNIISLCNYEKHQRSESEANAPPNATLTQPQRNPNAQKKQGNKETRETSVSQDARAAKVLAEVVPEQIAVDFVAHRRSLKKPLSDKAAQMVVSKIESHHDPGSVLRDSIANGWQGVFPEKTTRQHNDRTQQYPKAKRSDAALEQISRLA